MFSHIMVGSNDIARSKKFYDALFTAIGGARCEGRLAYTHNGGRFMVTKPNDGKPASSANGGTSIEDPPGKRPNGAYLAYLRDPDGHKLVGLLGKAPDLFAQKI
jgi:catechol 2,3-dioxygenase-like lactoylglutathione lyase family enzyme